MADEKKSKQKQVRVLWEDATEYKYANNLFIAQNGEEFCLVFGHLAPPNTTNRTVEEIADTVYVKPVASLVISPNSLEAFIKLLNDQFNDFNKKRGK